MSGRDTTTPRGSWSPVRRALRAAVALVLLGSASGCSLFGHHDTATVVPVLKAVPGDCVVAPTAITTEITDLKVVPCSEPHQQEVYALAPYPVASGSASSAPYPGDAALKAFADGACLDAFAGYVGSDYRDSSLYFTYLLPSARGWQAGEDRDVTCFITTTGAMRTSSVKGSDL